MELSGSGRQRYERQIKNIQAGLGNFYAPEQVFTHCTDYFKQISSIYADQYKDLLKKFNISISNYVNCPLLYLTNNKYRLEISASSLLAARKDNLTVQVALDILQNWGETANFNPPPNQEQTYRDYLWLQILDYISTDQTVLKITKLEPGEYLVLDLGLTVTDVTPFCCRHNYHPYVTQDPQLYEPIAKILDTRDQQLLAKIPQDMVNRDIKDHDCYYLETGKLVTPTKIKTCKFSDSDYLICSNHEPLFNYYLQQLTNKISKYACNLNYYLELHKNNPDKYINLDTGRVCSKLDKSFIIDAARRIGSKDNTRLEFYQTKIEAPVIISTVPSLPILTNTSLLSTVFASNTSPTIPTTVLSQTDPFSIFNSYPMCPPTLTPTKVNSKPRKEKIPQDIRVKVWEQYNPAMQGKCFLCQDQLHFRQFHAGHILAEAEGGQVSLDNLVPLCPQCNVVMGKTYLFDFVRQGRLAYINTNINLQTLILKLGPQDLKEYVFKLTQSKF